MGHGPAAVLATYGALWESDIAGVILRAPPPTHMDPAAPQLLNVLRVCDVPHVMGMLGAPAVDAPRLPGGPVAAGGRNLRRRRIVRQPALIAQFALASRR